MKKLRALLIFALAVALCAPILPVRASSSPLKLWIDDYHDTDGDGPGDFSHFITMVEGLGISVDWKSEAITAAALADYDVLVF